MHKPKRISKVVLMLLSLGIFVSSCGELEKHNTLKLAHGLPTDHPVHEAMVFMADRCKEVSGGELQIQIYAGGQLGSEQQ
ncbi:MAG: TRAP transporter substrate-binding protein, partial [Cyclobacteriaceae bacterium]|nr:TRAP transporter substrate-binding protein [Cyclobacteriaceae bacterium]